VLTTLLIILIPVGFFVGYIVIMTVESAASNRDFSAQHPEDPFSKGMDAAWTGKGPTPTKQDRSDHIRRAILWDRLNPFGRTLSKAQREAIRKSAEEVAARAASAEATGSNKVSSEDQ